jgi:hypothetical protein
MKNLLTFLIAIFLCFSVCGESSLAQEPVGIIKGIVMNDAGVLANAQLTLEKKGEKARFKNTRSTNTNGEFFILSHFGEYELTTEYLCTKRVDDITVNSEKPLYLTLTLPSENCEDKAAREEAEWQVCKNTNRNNPEVSDFYKAELTNQILQELFDYEIQLDSPVRENSDIREATVSLENIKAEWVKPLPKIKINLLSKQEIQTRTDNEYNLYYLVFSKWEQYNSCIAVELRLDIKRGKNAMAGASCGNGKYVKYLYRRDADKWKRKLISVL